MIYAGIGSRETPHNILLEMEAIGHHLSELGWTLRSGAADGADSAFERGCDISNGKKEIYIPWTGFSGRRLGERGICVFQDPMHEKIAAQFHPNWGACSQGARKLHARNVAQVLGEDANTPATLIICWTKGGSGAGGTGQALRMAKHYEIPIYDLGAPDGFDRLNNYFFPKS